MAIISLKSVLRAPKTSIGYPHTGPSVEYRVVLVLRSMKFLAKADEIFSELFLDIRCRRAELLCVPEPEAQSHEYLKMGFRFELVLAQ